jgi:nitric oxide reductase NorD protein
MADTDLRPLRILASAIAGRSVEVAPAAPAARTWTDGRTIFLEPGVDRRDRLRLLAVQASLLAGGSLEPELVAALRGRRGLAARYLAVEGHRALAANDQALPRWMHPMIDHGVAARLDAPSDSLDLARRDRGLVPAWAFGAVDARRVTGAGDPRPPSDPLDPGPGAAHAEVADLEELEDAGDDGPDLGTTLSSPVGGGGPVGRLLARLLRPTRNRDGGGDPGADSPTHRSTAPSPAGRSRVSVVLPGATLEGVEPEAPLAHLYPEWDERRQAYRPDWCHVLEPAAAAEPTARLVLPDGVALRRALARLGTELVPCRRQRQGLDLDIDAVVEAHVDRLAGGRQVDDVYLDTLRRSRGLSVLVLLDVSGSAAEPGVAGRTVHEHQREAAGALVDALHRLGDRVALHAFSSRGRTAVQVVPVKGFDERLDERVAQRLAGLRPAAFTRLGAAIRHGTALLDAGGGTPRRLLVVLSDGFAYDHGYEGSYGETDARRALLEARRRGVGCLCLSVGADVDLGALRRVFGGTAHASVPTAEQLAASIGPLFAAALRSAEAQRRSFQRVERTRGRLQQDRRDR